MGYLFLLYSLLSGAIKGFCGKKTSGYMTVYKDAIFANILRMFFCIIIGFIMVIAESGFSAFKIDGLTCIIAAVAGIATAIFVVSWLISVKKGAFMMVDVFLMLGVIVPLIGSNILFNEGVKPSQWAGLLLLFVAVFIMCSYNNSIKEKIKFSSFILLEVCGVSNGISDLSQKVFVEYSNGEISVSVFNFYTYLFATIMLFILHIASANKYKNIKTDSKIKSILLYIFVMSICLFATSYFKTKAASVLPATQIYPLCQGGGLVLSSLMATIFFKEKLTAKGILGIILSFLALIIINVL